MVWLVGLHCEILDKSYVTESLIAGLFVFRCFFRAVILGPGRKICKVSWRRSKRLIQQCKASEPNLE